MILLLIFKKFYFLLHLEKKSYLLRDHHQYPLLHSIQPHQISIRSMYILTNDTYLIKVLLGFYMLGLINNLPVFLELFGENPQVTFEINESK